MSLIPFLDDALYRPRHHQLSVWRDPEEHLVRNLLRYPLDEIRSLQSMLQDTGATITSDKNSYQANIDVAQFKPEEISVKVTDDNTITIEGKHEEKEDEHGYISRHFVRRYVLPEHCDMRHVQSKLSSDGVLTITAPKEKAIGHKEIPIIRTGQPVKRVEHKPAQEERRSKIFQ